MEWVASTLHTTSEHGVSSITTSDAHTSARLPVVDLNDAPAYLNGLVRFPERRNLVSERVPSHFKRSLHFSNHIYRYRKKLLYRVQNTTALQPNIFLTGTYLLLVASKEGLAFSSANHRQGQLQTPRSLPVLFVT
jgi:hypothetical protein